MTYIFFLALIAFSKASVIKDNKIHCLSIGDQIYDKETLKVGVTNPYQMVIDYDTNTLFYSYTARSKHYFEIEYLSLKTGESGKVTGISNGFATAVNLKGHKIYMGGDDGLYEYNYDTKSASKSEVNIDLNIWQMFYKDGLYFTTYPDETAYLYKDGVIAKLPELTDVRVLAIAVQNNGNYIYGNSSGVFVYDKTNKKSVSLGDNVVNGFTTDADGNVYFSTENGIYRITDNENKIKNVVQLNNIYGAAFEADGKIIYAAEESIVRLTPTNQLCNDKPTA